MLASNRFFILVAFLLSVILTGCTITIVSAYDEVTDKSVTQLQRDVESFFVGIESKSGLPECTYESNKGFYEKAKVDISAIEVRARAVPNNDITIKQIELLNDSLKKLETLHKIRCFDEDTVAPLRSSFNSSFTSILKFELAKKRGE
ncbi:hypothetical protein ACEUKD_08400 [Vibrio diabolicus]|uniref:hypothetical protein n=1 Tax=Vibrio harveyi group TaxID=717610 RepID=UPI001070FFB4|nr:hypothetical protein [Vibrio parahaemolyticus]MDF4641747.1 hypothetical protein [Vibrio parahaemolyticus]HDY7896818.1 hypothetical protein [Vibrio vulnificus]